MTKKNSHIGNLPPSEYWEDSRWAHDHMSDLAEKYPNLWVAVVNKKVVATGKVISEVERIVQEKTGRVEFPVILAEKGIRVYQDQSRI